LKLLLDEHVWPRVAELVLRALPTAQIESLHHHAGGGLLNTDDAVLLGEACRGGWTLVTFDVNTIPALLRDMAVTGQEHGGVIFISSKSFAQNDHAGLAEALGELWRTESDADWTNRVVFLSRAK
jgi:predicted nuclease of predicted toxin-antitoxin system